MNRLTQFLLSGVVLVVSSTAIAEVTFFDAGNFGGRRMALDRPTSNFRDSGFNDRVQSAIIAGESWEVCNDSNFGGDCTVLEPGRYPNLGAWANRISSARPVAPALPQPAVVAGPSVGNVTFYETENFGGRRFRLDQPFSDFIAARFSEHAKSAIVEGNPWELCPDVSFRGGCQILLPGRYPTLVNLGGRVSSARPSYEPRGEVRPGGRPSRAGATLFAGPNLTGRPFPLGAEGESNLDGLFNDRASSLRIERGYWIFCSDADFRGTCRTFGPGDYAALPYELDGRISSGRRISNDFPYSQNPNWRQR